MIERMRLRNFRRYRDATLAFREGVNFIEGLNNVGKTTLFYAIEYALFGRVENFKTLRSLAQSGKKSLGVELLFVGAKGDRYLLQRVHMTPPKSKKTMEGHFTLKAVLDDGEKYLLASDFGDTEDKLALKLQELTGLTRRLFSVALHMRQGEIPSILDGAKQLDIVLGVTAASIAEDELRQMALELEKESAGLAVLQERLRAVGVEMGVVANELANLASERKATSDKLTALGEAADPRVELSRQLTPLQEALEGYEKRRHQGELERRRLADEQERQAEAIRAGTVEDVEKELAKLQSVVKTRETKLKKLRADLEALDGEQRKLDQQRGDLAGRIERRQGLPKGKGAKCEVCGAAIDAKQTAKELTQWTAELEKLDASLAESAKRLSEMQSALDNEAAEERAQFERVAQLKEQRNQLAEIAEDLELRKKESTDADAAEKAGFVAIRTEAGKLTAVLEREAPSARWNLDGEPTEAIAAIREAIQTLHQSLAERVGRQVAERKALADLLERMDNQAQSVRKRQTDLEREQATAMAAAGAQQAKAARAARFRKLSAAFKDLQVQIRTEAATKLSADTIAMHRLLAESDEFESLNIDPNHYAVQVVPRELGEEVPAALYEGGGHRLLLGLAFRLAVAKLVDHCPFIMLDEPTYGLDTVHRDALLTRIASPNVARQILLVTHHARSAAPGHRIRVARQDRETVVDDKNEGK